MVEKKEDDPLSTQGFFYEFDGIKFKSKEDLESYKNPPKKSEKEISEEKIVEDAKAEVDRVSKINAEAVRVAQEKADAIAKEKAEEKEAARIAEVDRVAQEKVDAIAKEKAKSSRENIGDIKSDEINKRKATKFWWLA